MMEMPKGFVRVCGRSDYSGPVIEYQCDDNVYRSGHPLWKCLLFIWLSRLGWFGSRVKYVKLVSKGSGGDIITMNPTVSFWMAYLTFLGIVFPALYIMGVLQ